MDRLEVEFNNYKLTCLDDLKNCNGIDELKVKGYEDLTEENKEYNTLRYTMVLIKKEPYIKVQNNSELRTAILNSII